MKEFSNNASKFWGGLKGSERTLFVGGVIGVLVLLGLLMFWTFRTDYQVLFSELDTRDAAAIVEELKRMKVPYRLADGGTRILVEEEVVHETRLGLMGRGVSLSGGVGFEIFDSKDVGMTEYTQKINYQRALQGELARTIMAIEQIKYARVHLVVTESGLFKRQKAQPKASVSLVMKPGANLKTEQVSGIQRLVAAAVPGLEVGRVTVSDQHGMTLSQTNESSEELAMASGHLRLKKQAEDYLARKVVEVMDGTFGPGQAIVSVDVTLDFDEIHRTEESLAPYRSRDGMTGAIVRKRQSVQRSSRGPITTALDGDTEYAAAASPVTSTTEVEYEIGKTIEQVVSQPGGVKRVSVGVVVPGQLDQEQLTRVRELVSMAVGFSEDRGDAITIQPIDRLANKVEEPAFPVGSVPAIEPEPGRAPSLSQQPSVSLEWLSQKLERLPREWLWAGGGLITLLFGVLVFSILRRGRATSRSRRDREQLLSELRVWLDRQKNASRGVQGARP